MEKTVIKPALRIVMGDIVSTYANVTIHRSAIMCVDAYKSQLGWRTSQQTTEKKYLHILWKHVFLLLMPALIVQVGILYWDNDDECLFRFCRPTREIFHIYGDVTITGKYGDVTITGKGL